MQKIECLESSEKGTKLTRKEFWAAFGEVAPQKDPAVKAAAKAAKKRSKFWKRFRAKVPEACAKTAVRFAIVAIAISVLVACGINPVRLLVSKFI